MSASIIIPTYNGERFVDSIIKNLQTYYDKGYELVLVDDGSKAEDRCLERFQEHFPKAICVKKKNGGLASARNVGALHATKDYFQFLDIDDTISEDKIEKQIAHLEQTQSDVVYSDWRMTNVYEYKANEYEDWVIESAQEDYIYSLISGWWNPFHSYLFTRESYAKISGGNPNLVNAQDFDVVVRMAIQDLNFSYTPGKFCEYYRYHKHTSLARGDRTKYWKDTEWVVEQCLRLLDEKNNLSQKYKEAAALRLFLVARNVYKIDKSWNDRLYQRVMQLKPDFCAETESKKFQLLYKTLGYSLSEKILSLMK